MSYETENISNFQSEFHKFESYLRDWRDNDHSDHSKFLYLRQFSTKLRMPFGIKEIQLEPEFLDEKRSDIKELHKFLYKTVDLWFAYEAFFELYKKLNNDKPLSKSRTVWVTQTSSRQFHSEIISAAVSQANAKLKQDFYSTINSGLLKQYIHHCAKFAIEGQQKRLKKIEVKYGQGLTSTELLTITYAIRNNYVHHGETTITNAGLENFNFNFDESQKLKLIKICYNFLAIFTVNIANTLIEKQT